MASNNTLLLSSTVASMMNATITLTRGYTNPNASNQDSRDHVVTTISLIRVSIYAVCLFLGIFGNAIVIITCICQKKATRSRLLMAHLAFTDIVFCLRLPIQMQLELNGNQWNYGAVMCKLFHCVNSMSMLASIGTMTIIAVERYRGITKVLLAKMTRGKILLSIAIVWIISIITYSPLFILRNVTNNKCRESLLNADLQKAYSLFLFFMKYLLPLSIIGFCYWKIARVIRNRPILAFEHGSANTARQRRRQRTDNRIIRMLIVMVVAFAVLTLPASIWWILYDFGGFDSSESSMEIIEVFGALVYFHSCVNPFVYYVMDKKFRCDVKKLFKCSLRVKLLNRTYDLNSGPKQSQTIADNSTVFALAYSEKSS